VPVPSEDLTAVVQSEGGTGAAFNHDFNNILKNNKNTFRIALETISLSLSMDFMLDYAFLVKLAYHYIMYV